MNHNDNQETQTANPTGVEVYLSMILGFFLTLSEPACLDYEKV